MSLETNSRGLFLGRTKTVFFFSGGGLSMTVHIFCAILVANTRMLKKKQHTRSLAHC